MTREKIKELYLSGCSVQEISDRLKMSPSGIRYVLIKSDTKMRSRSEAVRMKHHKRLRSYGSTLPKNIPEELQSLYVAGLALYWGEGSKTSNTVAIANSDPDLVLVFLSFLRKLCHVDEKRLRVLLHYHEGQNEKDLLVFWSKITKIRKSQFYASTVHRKSEGSTKRLEFGTVSLRYSDSFLLAEILNRIQVLKIVI